MTPPVTPPNQKVVREGAGLDGEGLSVMSVMIHGMGTNVRFVYYLYNK